MAEPTFAVYVVAIEDSIKGFEAICDLPGLVTMETIEQDRTEADAIRIVVEIDEGDWG